MKQTKRLWTIFLTMLSISAMTFGGGFVIVSLMKKKYVDRYQWLSEEEMLDMIALAQSAPGAIAVNAAILTGYRLAGVAGIVVSVLATVLPPIAILSLISLFYAAFRSNRVVTCVLKGMQIGVAAVIFDVVADMSVTLAKRKNIVLGLLAVTAFVVVFFLHVNVLLVILAAVALGILFAVSDRRRKKI